MSNTSPPTWGVVPSDDDDGVFAGAPEVEWASGFGVEDLAGSPVPPHAATQAPRPQIPEGGPVIEQPPRLTADTEEPEWASVGVVRDEPVPAQQPVAPVVPQRPTPPAPVVAAQPAPVVAAQPAPVVAPQPVSAPVDEAPYWEQPAAPTSAPEPSAAPVEPIEPTTPVAGPGPDRIPPRRAPWSRPKKPASKSPAASSTKSKGGSSPTARFAGGRWRVLAVRTVVYTVGGVLMLGGVRNVVAPRPAPDLAKITSQVEQRLGETGFPTTTAQGFALRFANSYLNYDPATTQARIDALAVYSPDAADGVWGWTGGAGKQAVVNGPFLAAKPEVKDRNNAVITVTALTDAGSWVYLAIPVYASNTGGLVVSGPPAFVSPPARTDTPPVPAQGTGDDALTATLTTDVLPGYFKAWAASSTVDVRRYVTADATPAAVNGLSGAFTFGQIGQVFMPTEGGDTRTGTVDVTWTNKKAGSFVQSYKVTVVKDPSGKWSVKDLTGGVVTGAASASTATSPGAAASPGVVTTPAP